MSESLRDTETIRAAQDAVKVMTAMAQEMANQGLNGSAAAFAEHLFTVHEALREADRLVGRLQAAEQERDDKQIVIDAKLALEEHLYERLHGAEHAAKEAEWGARYAQDALQAAEQERDEAICIRDGYISPVQKVLQLRDRVVALETAASLPDGVGHWWKGAAHWFDPASTPMPGCPLCVALSVSPAPTLTEASAYVRLCDLECWQTGNCTGACGHPAHPAAVSPAPQEQQ